MTLNVWRAMQRGLGLSEEQVDYTFDELVLGAVSGNGGGNSGATLEQVISYVRIGTSVEAPDLYTPVKDSLDRLVGASKLRFEASKFYTV